MWQEGSSRSHHSIPPFQTGIASMKVILLHGNLDIWVKEAMNLPNMDMFHKSLGKMLGRLPRNLGSKVERHMPSSKVTSDPYVTVSVAGAAIGRTFVTKSSKNPVWMQHFNVPVAHYAFAVEFFVKDDEIVGAGVLGSVEIPAQNLMSGERIEGWFPLISDVKHRKAEPVLSLSIQYTPVERVDMYRQGVGIGPHYQGVPGTYFPLRKGGTVTLYQDAHVAEGSLPNVYLDRGRIYEHGQCWHDIYNAIRQARHLIYIAGWSVYPLVSLVRDTGNAENYILGNLLKEKSQEGVRVLLLLWDDLTSREILGHEKGGFMKTGDEETRRYFKNSSVQVILCPRSAGKKHSIAGKLETGFFYSHHQKTVIADADAGHDKRKIIAFVGGLDLTKGRYDTPGHQLFRTLQTVHKDDYHNPSFKGSTDGCPRQPWHDLHCQIDGPAAYDILTNFEERWLKASKKYFLREFMSSQDNTLLKLDSIPDILGSTDAPWLSEDDPQGWHVQVFRSIDSNSAKGFPKDPKEATNKNLVCGKNVLIDMSIHTAYVKAIRSAQHFIYIENQFFLGSSFNWNENSLNDQGANHLIPLEIALKISSKIRAHERFSAYIVVPMWPEGVPTSNANRRILYWQTETMEMMYTTIHKALVEVGLDREYEPQDYLNFFCLGNREVADHRDPSADAGSSSANYTPQVFVRKNRRFMIYVHSKGMIVDDEYVIIGSANINQRSMEGTRDTEIAMGAYQPHHTWAKQHTNPVGQINGYRMSLWAEHMGGLENCFLQPENLECVKRVRWLAEQNWRQFEADETTDMRAHLLKYPVEVDRTGKVRPLPGCETFPDFGGYIIGDVFLPIKENMTT